MRKGFNAEPAQHAETGSPGSRRRRRLRKVVAELIWGPSKDRAEAARPPPRRRKAVSVTDLSQLVALTDLEAAAEMMNTDLGGQGPPRWSEPGPEPSWRHGSVDTVFGGGATRSPGLNGRWATGSPATRTGKRPRSSDGQRPQSANLCERPVDWNSAWSSAQDSGLGDLDDTLFSHWVGTTLFSTWVGRGHDDGDHHGDHRDEHGVRDGLAVGGATDNTVTG